MDPLETASLRFEVFYWSAQRPSDLHVTFSVRLHTPGQWFSLFRREQDESISSLQTRSLFPTLSESRGQKKTLRASYGFSSPGANPFLVRLQNFSLEAVLGGEWLSPLRLKRDAK